MPTIGNDFLTLGDWAKRLDPGGNIAQIVEVLSQTNEIIDDMLVVEGNLPTGHRTTVREGLPDVYWRKVNAGVPDSKSKAAQVDEAAGRAEAFSKVDEALVELASNGPALRFSEDAAFIEAMNQQITQTLFYGNTDTAPEEFLGLAPRFGDSTAGNGENIIKGDGAGSDNTSIWLVGWSPRTCHAFFPKGTRAGLEQNDLGRQLVQDSDSNDYRAWVTQFIWRIGLAVRDWRYVVRIANVDVSNLTKDAATGADLVDLMTEALEQIQSLSGVMPRFYCNRTIRSYLRRQMRNSKNVNLTLDTVAGRKVLHFDEVPVRMVDGITGTEATVS